MSDVYNKIVTLRGLKQNIKFFQRIIFFLDIEENDDEINKDINEIESSINNLKSHLEEFINKKILEAYKLMPSDYKEQRHIDFYIGPDVSSKIENVKWYKDVRTKLKPIIKIFKIKPGVYSDRLQSSKIGNDIVYSRSVGFDFECDESFQNMTVTIMIRERLLNSAIGKTGADKKIYESKIKIK